MFGERLKSERKRLGLTQETFGELCGVKLLAQSNYESGKRSPDADYLQKAHQAGVDVGYLVTGQQTAFTQLDENERQLIEKLRQLSDEQKSAVMRFLLNN